MSKELRFEQLPFVTEFFTKIVKSHGLDCTPMPDGVVVSKDGKITFQFVLHSIRDQPDQKTIQLDFCTSFETAEHVPVEIVESYAGFGATVRDAVMEATKNMVSGSFHAVFSAVSGLPPCKCVENTVEIWKIAGQSRKVFLGPLFTRADFSEMKDKVYNVFLAKVQEAVSSLEMNEEINWFRLFYSRSGDQVTTEAHWNNKRCPQLLPLLKDIPWPPLKADQSGSLRFFFVVQKLGLTIPRDLI